MTNPIAMQNLMVQGTRLNDSDALSLVTAQAPGNLSAVFGEHGSPEGGPPYAEPTVLPGRAAAPVT